MKLNQSPTEQIAPPAALRVSLAGGSLPAMISYAQNQEDVLIRRALQDIHGGFYIDAGACNGVAESVTNWFYLNGWRGVNVEPSPALHAALELDRPEDINLWCALGAETGTRMLAVVGETGLSTLVEELAALADSAGYEITGRTMVPVETLNQVLERYGADRVIDFLKLDVEGSEEEILNAASFEAVRPRLLIVEAVRPFTVEPRWAGWEPGLLKQGYLFAWYDGLNRYYLRKEDEWRMQFFGIPPGVFDNFRAGGHVAALDQLSAEQEASRDLREQLARQAAESAATIEALRAGIAVREAALASAGGEAAANCSLRVELEGLAAECGPKDQALAAATAQCQALEARLASAEQSLTVGGARCDALAATAESQTAALEASDAELLLYSVRLLAEQREVRDGKEQLGALNRRLEERERAVAELSERTAAQERQLAELSASLVGAAREIHEHRLVIEDLRKQRDAVLGSLSWRLMEPIRRVAKLLGQG